MNISERNKTRKHHRKVPQGENQEITEIQRKKGHEQKQEVAKTSKAHPMSDRHYRTWLPTSGINNEQSIMGKHLLYCCEHKVWCLVNNEGVLTQQTLCDSRHNSQ